MGDVQKAAVGGPGNAQSGDNRLDQCLPVGLEDLRQRSYFFDIVQLDAAAERRHHYVLVCHSCARGGNAHDAATPGDFTRSSLEQVQCRAVDDRHIVLAHSGTQRGKVPPANHDRPACASRLAVDGMDHGAIGHSIQRDFGDLDGFELALYLLQFQLFDELLGILLCPLYSQLIPESIQIVLGKIPASILVLDFIDRVRLFGADKVREIGDAPPCRIYLDLGKPSTIQAVPLGFDG